MTVHRAAAAAAVLLALAAPAAAQTPESGEWVVRRGGDTIATETYTRTPQRLEAELATRTPAMRQRWNAELAADARVPRMGFTALPGRAGEAEPVASGTVSFRGDSAVLEVRGPTATPPLRFAPGQGALPYLNLSAALLEQVVRRARAVGGREARVPMLNLSGGNTFSAVVGFPAADSAFVDVGGVTLRFAADASGRLLGGCVPSQGITMERRGRTTECAASPAADYSAPAGAPYRAEEVTVRTPSGVTLTGTLTLPIGAAGRVPAVLLLSGSGPQDRDEAISAIPGYRPFRQVADTLSRRGIAVLRLDDRGVGGSGGAGPGVTTADFADDARAAVAYLRARPEVAPGRIGLAGHSEGGVVAPMVAAADPRIRGVALLAAPSRPGRELSMYQNRALVDAIPGLTAAQRDSIMAGVPAQLDALEAASPWLRYWFAYDPRPTLRRVRAPVLVLQGATDRQVPEAQARELAGTARAAGNRDVTLRVFAGLNHLFVPDPEGTADVQRYAALPSKQVQPEVLGALADWLAAKLR
jgi:dienelactone hydrolase